MERARSERMGEGGILDGGSERREDGYTTYEAVYKSASIVCRWAGPGW